jgi:hypothetical protein
LFSLKGFGLDGVEAYSSYHSPPQSAYYARAARALGLLVTLGSDFHGKTKPKVRLGQVDCQEDLAELADRFMCGLKGRAG